MKKIDFKNILQIILGSIIFAIGIEWFASPNKIVTGGASGAAIILTNLINFLTDINIPISLLVLLINIPIFIMSFIVSGKKFVEKSLFATLMMTFWLAVFNKIPSFFVIENDIFITTIITGVLCGTGSGLILKVGAASGGSDMLANSLNKIFPQFSIATIILVIDACVVLLGFLIFGPIKTSYAILEIFIGSKIINSILGGLRFARAVFVITNKTEEISQDIFKKLNRSSTNVNCTGMYTKKEKNLLIVVVMPKEIIKLKRIIESKDEQAFVIITPAQEVLGKGFLKWKLKIINRSTSYIFKKCI